MEFDVAVVSHRRATVAWITRFKPMLTIDISKADSRNPLVLSSSFTFFFKVVTPFLLLSFGGFVLIAPLFLLGATVSYYLFALLWLAVAGANNWWNNFPLKKVTVDARHLHVSNYCRQIDIPLGFVRAVIKTGRPTLWWRWPPLRVIITFSQPTEFGSRIMFIPGYYVEDLLRDLNQTLQGRYSL